MDFSHVIYKSKGYKSCRKWQMRSWPRAINVRQDDTQMADDQLISSVKQQATNSVEQEANIIAATIEIY